MVSRSFTFLLPAWGSLCSCGHGAEGNAYGKALTELFREINEGLHAVKWGAL